MKVVAAVLAVAAAGAGAAHADQDRAALYTALAAHQCRLAPDEVADVLAPQGFAPQFVHRTLADLIVSGTASMDARGALSLPVELCPPVTAVPSPKDRLLDAFARNECRLRQEQVPAIAESIGASEAQLRAVIEPLYETGSVRVAGTVATLSDTLCRAREG